MSNPQGSGGVCWWCCMRVLEKCLPRNDIVRELAPYLQHVHRDDAVDEESRRVHGDHSVAGEGHGRIVRTPRGCEFVAYEETTESGTSSDSHRHPPLLYSASIEQPDDVDEIVGPRGQRGSGADSLQGATPSARPQHTLAQSGGRTGANASGCSGQQPPKFQLLQHGSIRMASAPASTADSSAPRSAPGSGASATDYQQVASAAATLAREPLGVPLQKKASLPKIKTDLGDLVPVRWEKVVIVQVSVEGFRELMNQHRDLMDEAKLLYEHTVLSRLSTEYGGQEVMSHPRSGLFVIAFASEFHAAKWCLSLQLSLLYAAWNEKLLKLSPDVREEYESSNGRSKKSLVYRGFRVRMVIHTADPEIQPEKSLADAVKWTNTVSEYAHGGQIVLSDSVWDRLKEQLVQLGNPVVEDLGCHMLLGEEVTLMQLLPRDLELRKCKKLESPLMLSPGMRDAPSAKDPVTMVFTFIEGARPLVRSHAEELAERIKTLCTVARELLRKHNGYECQELQGDFMLAFSNPVSAVLWCSEFQLRIREKFREWSRQSQDQDLMFSMSMGVEVGIPASVSPHKTSGRADYFGNIVNQTARIAKAAQGGQILLGGDAWNKFCSIPNRTSIVRGSEALEADDGSTVIQFKAHGYYSFKGISLPIALIEAIPIEAPGSDVRKDLLVPSQIVSSSLSPKAKRIDDAQIPAQNKTVIAPVPFEMLRVFHVADVNFLTIRETQIYVRSGEDAESPDFGSGSPLVSGSATLAMSQNRPSRSGFLHFKSSGSIAASPRPARTERMDRI